MLYRGTTVENDRLDTASESRVQGKTFDILSGWMDQDALMGDYEGEFAHELPWDVPDGIEDDGFMVKQKSITGGFTELLSKAVQFAGGGGSWPVTLYFDSLTNATRVMYDHGSFEAFEGLAPWVDGNADGELRVNENLVGIVDEETDGYRVTDWGHSVGDQYRRYSDEHEAVVFSDSVSLDGQVDHMATFTHSPFDLLATLSERDTRQGAREKGREYALTELQKIGNAELDIDAPFWIIGSSGVILDTFWEFEESMVEGAAGPNGYVEYGDIPDHLLGY